MSVTNRLRNNSSPIGGLSSLGHDLPMLQQALELPLLTFAEEQRLARAARQGSLSAKHDLIVHNLRIVVTITGEFYPRKLERADIFQEGVIGLMQGIDRFDPDRGYRLITYVTWWIRQTIHRAIIDHGYEIRLPANKHHEYVRLCRFNDDYLSKHGRVPTDEEVAEASSVSEATVRFDRALRHSELQPSLDAPRMISGRRKPSVLTETLPNQTLSGISPELLSRAVLEQNRLQQEFHRRWTRIARTSARDRQLFTQFFGLDGQKPMSISACCTFWGVTKQRIHQLIERMLVRYLRLDSIDGNRKRWLQSEVERYFTLVEFTDPNRTSYVSLVPP
jgi:RNA polymerase sigma factor (sigma-70 family)